jgi:hypothetical protein
MVYGGRLSQVTVAASNFGMIIGAREFDRRLIFTSLTCDFHSITSALAFCDLIYKNSVKNAG